MCLSSQCIHAVAAIHLLSPTGFSFQNMRKKTKLHAFKMMDMMWTGRVHFLKCRDLYVRAKDKCFSPDLHHTYCCFSSNLSLSLLLPYITGSSLFFFLAFYNHNQKT